MTTIDNFMESLREIEDRFGITAGILMACPELPLRKSDRLLRNTLAFFFHVFLIRIQNHLIDDYYLKEIK